MVGVCIVMPEEWSHRPRPWRRNVGSQKYWNFLDISIRGLDSDFIGFHVTSLPVGETINRPCSDHSVCVLINIERVNRLWTLKVLIDWDRLWSANVFGISLWSFIRSVS
ncbi:hypothetical protein AVEN_214886-1 [Araneus ventricosus]|uniref:Uncharacterized protein n=1 Tax=Araneus ventricosus TaxID=182803 RepID=A0A4Y2SZN3_ARAVE|nr:hypothetical protein AVEN_214886-1 [Araneus ventricosus]